MIRLRRYIAGDAEGVSLRPELEGEKILLDGELLCPPGRAWTLTRRGQPVGCGGIIDRGYGRGYVWTILSSPDRATGLAMARACRKVIAEEGARFRRLEAHTPASFPAGADFLHWLGFACEGVCKAWGPDGADYLQYAKVST